MSQSDRETLPDLNGLIVVDKPAGLTSHDVVARVRRLVGMKRVGHGGTLDPFATGVLVVAVGRSTRLLQYVQDSDKRYRCHAVLGAATDTGDVDGVVVSRANATVWPEVSRIEGVLREFLGEIDQYPPAYSAIKIGGRKLYELARAGESIEIPSRRVTVHSIEIMSYEPPDLVVEVHCGKGTYIRSLARDIGERLGTFGYCHGLRRTAAGPFAIDAAWTLDELGGRDVREEWPVLAVHPDAALIGTRAALLSGDTVDAWYHGRSIHSDSLHDMHTASIVRGYGDLGNFLGLGKIDERGVMKPAMVMPANNEDGDR